MADSTVVANLDQKLIEESILDPAYREDCQAVHSMLNEKIQQIGKILNVESFKKGEDALKEMLNTLSRQGASQNKLTSLLRCGLAHLCLDYSESTYGNIPADELISRALQSFKIKDYNRRFFVPSSLLPETAPKPAVVTPVNKTVVKKAAPKKKTAVKKAAAKKTVKKAAPKKKAAVKKAAVKKTVKKSAVKKAVKKK